MIRLPRPSLLSRGRRAAALALGAALAFGLTACSRNAGGPPAFPPPAVRTAVAIQTDAPVVITAYGTTDDRVSVDVVPQVSGTLVRSYVRDGAIVTNGQPLFEIDPRDYAMRVRQVESQLAADKANLALARATLGRSRDLHAKKLLSDEDFDTLQARVDAATALVAADESLLEQARLSLSRCTITAPLAGVCSKRYLDDGNLAAAGLTRLINIRSYDPLNVEFSVSEHYLSAIRKAMLEPPVRIDVTPRGETNRYTGTLEFVDNAVNPLTGTILLRGQVPNADLKLWARQFVEVHVYAGAVRSSVLVPEGAIQFGKMGSYLFSVAPRPFSFTFTNTPTRVQAFFGAKPVVTTTNFTADAAAMRLVQTGVRHGDQIQVLGDVAPGERVVVLGQLMLYPGAQVTDLSLVNPAAAVPK